MATKIGIACSSFSCLASSLSSSSSSPFPFQHNHNHSHSRLINPQLSLLQFVNQQSGAQLKIYGKDKSYQFIHGMLKLKGSFQKQQTALFVICEDQSQYSELKIDALVPENHYFNSEDISPASNSSFHLSGSDGKPGVISFYNRPYRKDSEVILSNSDRTQNSVLWFMGPAALVASFIFPSLYLRRQLCVIF